MSIRKNNFFKTFRHHIHWESQIGKKNLLINHQEINEITSLKCSWTDFWIYFQFRYINMTFCLALSPRNLKSLKRLLEMLCFCVHPPNNWLKILKNVKEKQLLGIIQTTSSPFVTSWMCRGFQKMVEGWKWEWVFKVNFCTIRSTLKQHIYLKRIKLILICFQSTILLLNHLITKTC